MGIKNLFKLIREEAPGAITTKRISDLEGWRIGIDASLSIYQLTTVGGSIVNSDGKPINHLIGTFHRVVNMLINLIEPVYVFDGVPPVAKLPTLKLRRERRDTSHSHVNVTRGMFEEVSTLLGLMGVVCVYAPSEAEAQASYLTNNDSIDAVATEDTDVIAFNARYMIRQWGVGSDVVELIDVSEVLRELGLNRKAFIDLCILLGSDYTTKTLPNVGVKRALSLIRHHHTIETIMEIRKVSPEPEFDFEVARGEFMNPRVAKGIVESMPRKLGADDITKICEFMKRFGIDGRTISGGIRKLSEHYQIKA